MSFFPARRDLSVAYEEMVLDVRQRERRRLDIYLLEMLGWNSRARVQKAIASGRISMNGAPCKSSQRVAPGDRIRILLDPPTRPQATTPLGAPLFEDPYLLVLDKPAGRLVHPVGRSATGTLLNELHARYSGCNRSGLRTVLPMLCHRLDRETSGVLLAAKTERARRRLQDAFESGAVTKRYLAVVEGELAGERQEVRLPIAVIPERARETGNTLSVIHPSGKPACTVVERLCARDGWSLVSCRLLTGRQNQIRAHLAGIGHPILGDSGYGSERGRWQGGSALPFPDRALLHSHSLAFAHPVWGHPLHIEAAPPADLARFLSLASYS